MAQRFVSLSRKISASSVLSSGKTAQRNHLQQTEKETVCGQVQVSPSSRTMQLPSSQQQHSRRIRAFACFLHFAFRCRSPRKGFLPHSCGVFRRWHAPHSFGTSCPEVTSGQSVQKLAPCGASPAGVFLFGRSFGFQGAAHR